MDKKIGVSCIVPAYNVQDYIEQCIESLLCQSFLNYEIIIVNDGSKDATLEKIQKYQENDKVVIISQENLGLSAARNTGINHAKGEYITFIDSDDWIHEKYLECMYELAKKKEADVVTCDYLMVSDDGHEIQKKKSRKSVVRVQNKQCGDVLFSGECSNYAWGKLLKRELIDHDFFPYNRTYEDIGSMYKVFIKAHKIVISNEILYYYRIRQGSITATRTLRGVEDKLFFLGQMKQLEISTEYRYWIFYMLVKGFSIVADLYKIEKLEVGERNGYIKRVYDLVADLPLRCRDVRFNPDGLRVIMLKAHLSGLWFTTKKILGR